MKLMHMMFGAGESQEPDYDKGRGYTGSYSESACRGNRDSVLPDTPEATEASIKAYGEGSLQSGLAFRVAMGEELRVQGISTPHELPRFDMYGENKLPEYRRS
jgi:hypothetical protein